MCVDAPAAARTCGAAAGAGPCGGSGRGVSRRSGPEWPGTALHTAPRQCLGPARPCRMPGAVRRDVGASRFAAEALGGVLSALAPAGGYQSSWGTLLLVFRGGEAGCGARHVDQRPSGIGLSARRKAIAGSAAVTA